MPIYIDLLSEDHEAEEMRRKDPVKRAIFAGAALVVLSLLYWGYQQTAIMSINSEIAGKQSEWDGIESDFQLVTTNLSETASVERLLTDLYDYSTNRFLWAPVMSALQFHATPGIEIYRVRSEQKFTFIEPEVKKKKVVAPAKTTESIQFWVDARDSNIPPGGDKVNQFKQNLSKLEIFASQLEPVNGVLLTTLKPPVEDPNNPGSQYVDFTLQFKYPERTRVDAP